jgi:hypothetical protein
MTAEGSDFEIEDNYRSEFIPLLERGCCKTREEASVGAVYDRAFFLESTKYARS